MALATATFALPAPALEPRSFDRTRCCAVLHEPCGGLSAGVDCPGDGGSRRADRSAGPVIAVGVAVGAAACAGREGQRCQSDR